jgi:hypothetical protein
MRSPLSATKTNPHFGGFSDLRRVGKSGRLFVDIICFDQDCWLTESEVPPHFAENVRDMLFRLCPWLASQN